MNRKLWVVVFVSLALGCTAETEGGGSTGAVDVDETADVPDVVEDVIPDEGPAPDDVEDDEGVVEVVEPDEGPPPVDEGPPPDPTCADGLPIRTFEMPAVAGKLRHEVAGDFTITRMDGKSWTLSEKWTGCDTYVFIPDTLTNSQMDPSSVWERDIAELVKRSPPNVHYFFVSRQQSEEAATAATTAMFERVGAELATLDSETNDLWWDRLHVVDGRAVVLGGWLAGVLANGIGQLGFGIDRHQRLRGIGSMADVFRYNATLANNDAWPWEANMAYAANEAHYFNANAQHAHERAALYAAHPPTEVVLFDGGVIEGFEEIEVEIPDLAAFDTFEVEIEQRCPNEKLPEPGNCGAWDYLAHLSVYEAEPPAEGENPKRIELGRFITTYHREAHWVHDLSEMLPELDGGGTRKLRWEWAPEWNKQPTATWVTLRFSNRGKATRPSELIWLYGGGGFNAGYNEAHPPLEIAVPADAVKVELYVTISGHGMDQSNCAEFCNHVHEWTVNGEKFTESHGTVGQQDGCVQELENQMTPNQYGTWWFGRGGWCPGQPVMPWIVDVTDIVTPSEVADIHYQGFLNGGPPPDNSGNINMTSWLVVSK